MSKMRTSEIDGSSFKDAGRGVLAEKKVRILTTVSVVNGPILTVSMKPH